MTLQPTLKGYLPSDIYPWLFQRGYFQMPFSLHFLQSFKNLTQVLCHKIVDTIFQLKGNYVVSMISQISVPGETRADGSV